MSKKNKPICEVCQNEIQLVDGTGLCEACCFGEASALEPACSHVSKYQSVSVADLDALLKIEKGWVRYHNQGQDYVYEYCVPSSDIRIKVQSGVNIKTGTMEVPGFDAIKIYAILYIPAQGKNQKSVRGLCKSVRILTTEGWQERVKTVYKEVLSESRKVADRTRARRVH